MPAIRPTNCRARARRRPGRRGVAIRRYGRLEALLKAGRFRNQAAELRLYKSVATTNRKAAAQITRQDADLGQGRSAGSRAWQLNALAGRVEFLADGNKA